MAVTNLDLPPLQSLQLQRCEKAQPGLGARLIDHSRYVAFLEQRLLLYEFTVHDFVFPTGGDEQRSAALAKLVELDGNKDLRT